MTIATIDRQVARQQLARQLDEIFPLELSAETPRLAATPAPIGKPDGPGLWHVKNMQLPPYFQNVRNALMRSGHSVAQASQITWGAIRRWARGGGHVHPEVRSAAREALASLSSKEARAHAQRAEHEYVLSVQDQLILLEFANPYHGAAGSGKGGQFVSSSQTGGGSTPAGKSAAKPPGSAAKANANQPKPISNAQRSAYLKQAATYSTRAKALRQQAAAINRMISALSALIAQEQKALAISSSGKTAAGVGTHTGSGKGTKTTAGKGTKTSAASKAASAKSPTAKSNTQTSQSSLRTMLDANKQQMKQLVAKRDALLNAANKADQQAARFTRLAGG